MEQLQIESKSGMIKVLLWIEQWLEYWGWKYLCELIENRKFSILHWMTGNISVKVLKALRNPTVLRIYVSTLNFFIKFRGAVHHLLTVCRSVWLKMTAQVFILIYFYVGHCGSNFSFKWNGHTSNSTCNADETSYTYQIWQDFVSLTA